MKKCTKCNKLKHEIEFAIKRQKGSMIKHDAQCKECHRLYSKGHYTANKAVYKKRAKLSKQKCRDRNRELLIAYLQERHCIDCGEKDIRTLEFDHKNPADKEDNVSVLLQKRSWESVLKEINKCEIRCANCHRKKTFTHFGFRTLRS